MRITGPLSVHLSKIKKKDGSKDRKDCRINVKPGWSRLKTHFYIEGMILGVSFYTLPHTVLYNTPLGCPPYFVSLTRDSYVWPDLGEKRWTGWSRSLNPHMLPVHNKSTTVFIRHPVQRTIFNKNHTTPSTCRWKKEQIQRQTPAIPHPCMHPRTLTKLKMQQSLYD